MKAGNLLVPISVLIVAVKYPDPLLVSFAIRRAGAGSLRDFEHPDTEFNESCAVTTETSKQLITLLESRGLRKAIRAFVQAGKGSSVVDERGVFAPVWGAQTGGADAVTRAVKLAVRVAKAIHERAASLGMRSAQPTGTR